MLKDISAEIIGIVQAEFPTMIEEPLVESVLDLTSRHFENTGVFLKNNRREMVYANKAFINNMGLTSQSFIGKPGSVFLPPDLELLSASSDKIVLEENRVSVTTYDMPQGCYQTTKIPITNKDGTVIGMAGFSILIKKPNVDAFAHFSVEEHNELSEKLNQLKSNEVELIGLVSNGVLNKQIASHFDVSVRSVEKWRQNVLNTLEIKTTAQMIRFAVDCERYGLLPKFDLAKLNPA